MESHRIQTEPFRLSFALPPACSKRTRLIARWFNLEHPQADTESPPNRRTKLHAWLHKFLPSPGDVVLITGPSGAGKTSLLRAICAANAAQKACDWIDLAAIELPDRPTVDCLDVPDLDDALAMLSRVGLAEAQTYLRRPAELSEGQRWRLRLAIGLARSSGTCATRSEYGAGASAFDSDCHSTISRPQAFAGTVSRILTCDEFAAMLDRVTAAIVARSLRRAVSSSGSAALLATSHDDLVEALQPDLHIRCDFGSLHCQRGGERRESARLPCELKHIPHRRAG